MPIGQYLRNNYLKRGATLAELAQQLGIDAKALESTVAEFNKNAAEGRDPAFGKGSRAYTVTRATRCTGRTPASRRSNVGRSMRSSS
jgi:hypothetical protein